MNCETLTLEDVCITNGLDRLIEHLARTTQATPVFHGWEKWIAPALRQLELDDSFDAATTDGMVDALLEAEEAFEEGLCVETPLRSLVSLYLDDRKEETLESRWRAIAANLTRDELASDLWEGLQGALKSYTLGHNTKVLGWLESTENSFLQVWSEYESLEIIDEEITAESILFHHFLKEGIESWLEALVAFREFLTGQASVHKILTNAEQGQRMLMAVTIIEKSIATAESRQLLHFN